jgi:LytR cell envelope-related transcriptional attenuator
VVVAALAFGATRLFTGNETTPPPNRTAVSGTTPAAGTTQRGAALRPETVVAILNGTPTEGLASGTRDKLIAEGYSNEQGMIRTGNTIDQQRQDSVVLYATGKRRQARDVASIIGVDAVEQIDADTQTLADSTDDTGSGRHADVVAILGADQSP